MKFLGIFFPAYHSTRIDSLRVMRAVTDALERTLDLHLTADRQEITGVAPPATMIAQDGRSSD